MPLKVVFDKKHMKRINESSGQSTAIVELEAITKKREEVINGVKAALVTALTEAAGHFSLLQKEGLQTVLGEPQFKEACTMLGIQIPGEAPNNGNRASS